MGTPRLLEKLDFLILPCPKVLAAGAIGRQTGWMSAPFLLTILCPGWNLLYARRLFWLKERFQCQESRSDLYPSIIIIGTVIYPFRAEILESTLC